MNVTTCFRRRLPGSPIGGTPLAPMLYVPLRPSLFGPNEVPLVILSSRIFCTNTYQSLPVTAGLSVKYGRPLMNNPKVSPLTAQFVVSDGGKIVLVAGVVPFTKPNAQPLNVDPN